MANQDSAAANEPMVFLVRAVERVEEKLAELNTRVAHAMTHRRKTPNARVRNAHIAFVRSIGGRCPVDETPLFDEQDRFVGHIHHTEAASLAGMDQVMAVCSRCNSRHNFDPIPRAIVEAYHVKRKRVPAHHHPQQATLGPLFDLARRGAK